MGVLGFDTFQIVIGNFVIGQALTQLLAAGSLGILELITPQDLIR